MRDILNISVNFEAKSYVCDKMKLNTSVKSYVCDKDTMGAREYPPVVPRGGGGRYARASVHVCVHVCTDKRLDISIS